MIVQKGCFFVNILVLTSEYPGFFQDKENNITPVVHYFTKEWVKSGHNVIVINNAVRYPYFVHLLPNFIKGMVTKKIGYSIMGTDYLREEEYVWEGVKVWRFPIIKYIPHGDFSESVINKQIDKIKSVTTKLNFKPDLIIGHWPTPQMQILSKIKSFYNCPTALTFHGTRYMLKPKFDYNKYLKNIDAIGFRNYSDAKKVQEYLGLKELPYVCQSGIPDEYIEKIKPDFSKFNNMETIQFLYVGRLIDRKYVDVTIKALHESQIDNFVFNIIGSGPCENALRSLVSDLGMESKVKFLGRMSRDEVMSYYNKAHFFVMVSRDEAFGLVYLEAMCAGCIPIAAKGEGMDGIIIDGNNGFLLNAGDKNELVDLIDHIGRYINNDIVKLSLETRRDVEKISDSIVSKKYLEIIKESIEKIQYKQIGT